MAAWTFALYLLLAVHTHTPELKHDKRHSTWHSLWHSFDPISAARAMCSAEAGVDCIDDVVSRSFEQTESVIAKAGSFSDFDDGDVLALHSHAAIQAHQQVRPSEGYRTCAVLTTACSQSTSGLLLWRLFFAGMRGVARRLCARRTLMHGRLLPSRSDRLRRGSAGHGPSVTGACTPLRTPLRLLSVPSPLVWPHCRPGEGTRALLSA
jgi:hypothetical protein